MFSIESVLARDFAILSVEKELWGHHEETRRVLQEIEKKTKMHFWAALPDNEFVVSLPKQHRVLSASTGKHVRLKDMTTKPKSVYRTNDRDCVVFLSDSEVSVTSLLPFDTMGVFKVSFELMKSGENNVVVIHFEKPGDQKHIVEYLRKSEKVLFVECAVEYKIHTNHALQEAIQYAGPRTSKVFQFGEGVIVTVADTGLDTAHCRFLDTHHPVAQFTVHPENAKMVSDSIAQHPSKHERVAAYLRLQLRVGGGVYYSDFSDEEGGHGTHVSGSVLGYNAFSGCENPLYDLNYQNKAKILFIDVERTGSNSSGLLVPTSIYWLMQLSYDSGSRIFTNSWGSNINAYTFHAYQIDLFTHLHPTYSVIFSAGNSGPGAGTIGTPATSKNAIAVGSTLNSYSSFVEYANAKYPIYDMTRLDTVDVLASPHFYDPSHVSGFSSRGPTFDGRIKPDVVFPGEFILSSRAGKQSGAQQSNKLTLMRGTSMSAPLVASLLALIDERLTKTYHVPEPLASLRKSILITNTVSMRQSSQSVKYVQGENLMRIVSKNLTKSGVYEHGHGRVDLGAFMRGDIRFVDRLEFKTFSQPTTLCMKAVQHASEYVITLVYDDVPTVMNTETKTMINDVSMRVVVLANGKPKLLFEGNHGTERDTKNNVEQVRTELYAGQELRVSIYASGPITSLRPGRDQVQLASVSWNRNIAPEKCATECTELDPPFECMAGREIGYHPCVDGVYNRTACLPGSDLIEPCKDPARVRKATVANVSECVDLQEPAPRRRTLTQKKHGVSRATVLWAFMLISCVYIYAVFRRVI